MFEQKDVFIIEDQKELNYSPWRAITCQQKGPAFESRWDQPFCVEFAYYPVLQQPNTVQRHA